MSGFGDWLELKDTLRLFIFWMITTLMDSAFLALWVFVQWIVNTKIIAQLRLTGIDLLVLWVFQILFSISSLAPVAIWIYKDIRVLILRTQRKIRNESVIGDYDEPDRFAK